MDDEMRDHCDFSGGVRGKYLRRCAESTNAGVLDPEVPVAIPNRDAVNETLRAVAQIVQTQDRRQGRASKAGSPERGHVKVRRKRRRSRSGPPGDGNAALTHNCG